MTDLEITRLCADAMGINGLTEKRNRLVWERAREESHARLRSYEPIYNDAQAMALVKRFRLFITHDETEFWVEWAGPIGGDGKVSWRADPDLNRAICECVAKMQLAKQKEVA